MKISNLLGRTYLHPNGIFTIFTLYFKLERMFNEFKKQQYIFFHVGNSYKCRHEVMFWHSLIGLDADMKVIEKNATTTWQLISIFCQTDNKLLLNKHESICYYHWV